MLWVKGAPKLGIDSEEDICDFIDRYISGRLPDKEEDPELYERVSKLQVHSHRDKCQKDIKVQFSAEERASSTVEELEQKEKDRKCRYGFAKPVEEATRLSYTGNVQAKLKALELRHTVEVEKKKEEMKKEGRREADIEAMEQRMAKAHDKERFNILQSGNVEVILKRDLPDRYVNNYNPAVLLLWKANTDLQYITN